jgi:hypothetical protein
MNIAQLSEQLKDVPQNTLVGYAKNPNSVVPQFLALAEIQRRQQLQAPVQAPASTVANDVLNQATAPQVDPRVLQALAAQQQAPQQQPQAAQMAQQLPENQPGVAQLPSNMAQQGFANGGIVAFANGGMPDLIGEDDQDYQDYLENAEQGRIDSGIDEAIANLKGRVAGVAKAIPESVHSAVSGIQSVMPKSYAAAKKEYPNGMPGEKSEGLESLFKSTIKKLESGGKHFDSKGNILTSPKGAEGIMQVMRHTQRDPGFGVAPARDKSPEELQRVGEDYAIAMLREFKDPKIAAMAYNWGPGNVKKWLESGRKGPVPKETQQYASHFNQGGIAKLAIGGTPDDYSTTQDMEDREASPAYNSALEKYYAGQDAADAPYIPEAVIPAAGIPAMLNNPAKAPAVDRYNQFIENERAAQAELKAGKQQDLALALMQSGLATMGGTSPYAGVNIGQGGAAGISAYANLAKQRGTELAASRKLESSAIGNQILNQIRQAGIDEKAAASANALEEKAITREERSRQISLKEANDAREAAIARYNSDPEVKKLAALQADSQGTIQQQYYDKMLQIKRNNAFAEAGVPGYKMIAELPAVPTEPVKAPSDFWQSLPFTHKYSPEDIKALEWANANPLDPRANEIKKRFQ